jgi:hypothetical protein
MIGPAPLWRFRISCAAPAWTRERVAVTVQADLPADGRRSQTCR